MHSHMCEDARCIIIIIIIILSSSVATGAGGRGAHLFHDTALV